MTAKKPKDVAVEERAQPTEVVTAFKGKVGDNGIEADQFYMLTNGEFVEVQPSAHPKRPASRQHRRTAVNTSTSPGHSTDTAECSCPLCEGSIQLPPADHTKTLVVLTTLVALVCVAIVIYGLVRK